MSLIGNQVAKVVLDTFDNKRIISLLFFGSSAFTTQLNNKSDFDFLIVLDHYKSNDLIKLRRNLMKTSLDSNNLDISFLYRTDIESRGKNNFQIRTSQQTFYYYLQFAITLYGENIFKNNPIKLSRKQILSNFSFKIQEHYGRCDKLLLKSSSSKEIHKTLVKYCIDVTRYILIIEGLMSIKDITQFNPDMIIKIVDDNKVYSPSLRKQLPTLKKPYQKISDIHAVDKIRRQIYQYFLDHISK